MAVVQGNRHHDNPDAGSPVKIGGKAKSSAPTAVADSDRVDAYFDTQGRQVVVAVNSAGSDISGGDGAIVDGASAAIRGTVFDYTNSNPVAVRLTDTNGDFAAAGGGTQYTEDAAAAADPVGTTPILVRKDTPATITTTDGDNIAQRATNYGAAYVQVVNSSGSFVDTFGGGTQYTEDVASATDPVGTQLIARRRDSLAAETTTDGDNTAVNSTSKGELYVKHADTIAVTQSGTWDEVGINDSGNSITVDDGGSSLTVDNGGTFVTQENGAALAALQLIDDPVQVLGTDTYTEATSKGMTIGAVRRDADTTLVNTTNEFGPLQMDANGRLKVEAFSGETLPVSLASTTISSGSVTADTELPAAAALADNTANPTVPGVGGFAMLWDGATWDRSPGNQTDGTLVNLGANNDVTVTSGSITADTELPAAAALADNTSNPTAPAVGSFEMLWDGATWDRAPGNSTDGLTVNLGANNDVSLNAGSNLAGRVNLDPQTGNGLSIFRSLDLDETEEEIKASAGSVYGWYIANTATSTRFVKFYNATAANVTVGSTTPVITIPIPGNTSDDIAANALGAMGIAFDTAITVAATTGVADADTGAPAANDVIVNIFYK